MTAPAWDGLFATGSGAPRRRGPRWLPAYLTSWEDWITFALVGVALFAVIVSIEAADWVSEMPSLALAAFVGLLSGWVLSHAPGRAWLLHLVGVAIGVTVVFAEVMQSMRLSDPALQSGVRDRWGELWARNREWLDALLSGAASSDPLPFVLIVVFLAWALTYLAAWAVFRWRSPWLALAPGGFALLTNISYLPGQPSREFVIFLFAAILLFSRLYLLRTAAMPAATAAAAAGRARASQFLSLEVLNATWWMGLALVIVAFLLPTGDNLGPVSDAWERALAPVTERVDRLGRLFIGVDSKRGRDLHSFADVLPLQGRVTLSSEVLMHVTAAEALYLRSATFDEYGAAGWQVSAAERDLLPGTTVEAAQFGTPDTRAQFRRPVGVTVEAVAQPSNDRRLFVVGDPLAADVQAEAVVGAVRADLLGLRSGDAVQAGDQYSTVGSVSAASVERLVAAGSDYPQWVRERYLQLPEDLPPEVRELAAGLVADVDAPYLRARLVEQFLRSGYPFSLDIPDPPPRTDAVAYFLFTEQRGYFDYHASAMAVLLRAAGIPARVAVGFALDEADLDPETKAYVVTEQRAWAWTEVYFPGFGWVEFNPTPGRSLIARPGDDSVFLDVVAGLPAALADDIDDGFGDEMLFTDGGGGAGLIPPEPEAAGGGIGARVALLFTALMVIAAGGLTLMAAVRLFWGRAFHGLPPAAGRWARLQQLAAWAGVRPVATETPLEAAVAMRERLALRPELLPLARAYARERYGGALPEDPEDAEELDGLYADVRNDLWRDVLRRLARRGPRRR